MKDVHAFSTWTDSTLWRSGPDAFRALRSMRHSPPRAPGSNADRAELFRAALEQAQQQLSAARSVGYESRPLNLFYGLSQAGRAIAAAAAELGDHYPAGLQPKKNEASTPWELKGHGILADTDAVAADSFGEMVLSPSPKRKDRNPGLQASGSFVRLLGLLSPKCDLSAGVSIQELWASVPEAGPQPWIRGGLPAVTMDTYSIRGPDFDCLRGVIYSRSSSSRDAQSWRTVDDSSVAAFLDNYPALRGYRLTPPFADPIDGELIGAPGVLHIDHKVRVARLPPIYLPLYPGKWPTKTTPEELRRDLFSFATRNGTDYRGRRFLFPALAGSEPLHPLLTWWAILFGLSMLCRYRPVVWTELININTSPYASAIEHLLDAGLDAIPDLIERTIRSVQDLPIEDE